MFRVDYICSRAAAAPILFFFDNTSTTFVSSQISGKFSAPNTWELVDLGLANQISDVVITYSTSGTSEISMKLTPGATSATVDIDAALFLPVTDDGFGIFKSGPYITGDIGYILGTREEYNLDGDTSLATPSGELWTVPSGNKMSRFVFALTATNNIHDLTDGFSIEMTVTPQTRHLLGTT